MKKKHKLRKYTPHDFSDYVNFEKDLAGRKEQFCQLAAHADPEQIELLKECFDKIDRSKEKWLDGLDQAGVGNKSQNAQDFRDWDWNLGFIFKI